MKADTIIILNGASSSGKSTTLKALQAHFEEPFLDAGLDRFLWNSPTALRELRLRTQES